MITKKEQLRVVLRKLTREIVNRVSGEVISKNDGRIVDSYVDLMMKEILKRRWKKQNEDNK
jgi:hypothetical protein